MTDYEKIAKEAAKRITEKTTESELHSLKLELGKKYSMPRVLRNSEILEQVSKTEKTRGIIHVLLKRPMRTISGVAPIAVMAMAGCPHGRCTYCPRGENAPQSYTGLEPSTMRGIQNNYDPWKTTTSRLTQLEAIGHATDKCELIIQGGTFPAQPDSYTDCFVKRCFDALNESKSRNLKQAKKANESAKHRLIGMTIETRPDWCKEKHVDKMLEWGATRVEIGVQTLSEAVYRKVNRGHTLKDVYDATRIAKDACMKIGYHVMPGLYADKKKDVSYFKRLFSDARLKPDMLKIYPTLVLKGTELYEDWKRGEYKPYNTEEAVEAIAEATRYFPKWVRVMRMQRDIPVQNIVAGVKKSNLTQLVEAECKRNRVTCQCIRCREVGLKTLKQGIKVQAHEFSLETTKYKASGGEEVFLSFENKEHDALAGFLRLRLPGKSHRKEICPGTALVRELHVYGTALRLGEEPGQEVQHQGFGTMLLEKAEEIALKKGIEKMIIISGVGVRQYYLKRGYSYEGPYVSKRLGAEAVA